MQVLPHCSAPVTKISVDLQGESGKSCQQPQTQNTSRSGISSNNNNNDNDDDTSFQQKSRVFLSHLSRHTYQIFLSHTDNSDTSDPISRQGSWEQGNIYRFGFVMHTEVAS